MSLHTQRVWGCGYWEPSEQGKEARDLDAFPLILLGRYLGLGSLGGLLTTSFN